MRVIGGELVGFTSSGHIGGRMIVIDSGDGFLWKIASAFEGNGLYIRPELGSVGEVMHVYPIDRESVHLVQKSINSKEWWEGRMEELENAIKKTVEENKHLADGENCTLKHLVEVMASA